VDFEANLENYLRNTNEELNPEGIKRDLQYCSMIHEQDWEI